MSSLHQLCCLTLRPITAEGFLAPLSLLLSNGIPSTYTLEERLAYESSEIADERPAIEADAATELLESLAHGGEDISVLTRCYFPETQSTTTPLHLLFYNFPADATAQELAVVGQMADALFLNGAGWNLVDYNGKTPGCILIDRGLKHVDLYSQVLDAGVRSEMVFRKLDDAAEIEFVDDVAAAAETGAAAESEVAAEKESVADPADDNQTFLHTKLAYNRKALVTEDQQDGVMMDWESEIMKVAARSLFSSLDSTSEINILNIGFGMGIIDSFIQQQIVNHPGLTIHHYICEAHPDVLARMKQDGWYEKPNVHILAGTWKDQLDNLLTQGGVYFDGMYYDTFSEHYRPDMMPDLFDLAVGLVKPQGVISFFNGLGADRQVVYEVYARLVSLDLEDYGLAVTYSEIPVNISTTQDKPDGTWDNIRRSYWNCPVYYHPTIQFK